MSQHVEMNEAPEPPINLHDNLNAPEPVMPPNDLQTEQAILGAILMNNDAYYKIADELKPEHFYEGLHGDIYFKISELLAQNVTVSPITLKMFFEDHPVMKEIGGTNYLSKIMAETSASAYSIKGFVDNAIDLFKRRELIRIAQELEDNARDMNCQPDFADIAEVEINGLSQSGSEQAVYNIHDASMELLRRAEQALKDGDKIGLDFGMPSLNSLLGQMMPGDLIVLGGATSAGKTSLGQKIAMAVAQKNPALIFSLEMDAPEFTNRYLAQRSRISTEQIETGNLVLDEFDRLIEATEEFKKINMEIDGTPKLKVSQIRARAKKMLRESGLSFILIDHLGFIEFEHRGINKIDGLAEVTRDLKALAKEIRIPIIVISHLNREANKRENKRPMLSDLYGSSSIEKDADLVFFVHREQYWLERDAPVEDGSQEYHDWEQKLLDAKGKAEIIIAKRRRGKGAGFKLLEFDEKFTDFHELSIANPQPSQQKYYSSETMI